MYIFAHTFLILSWKLMYRAGNSGSIQWEHVQRHQDALAIRFSHMKNDQEGERRDARYVFANPLMPDSFARCARITFWLRWQWKKFPDGNQYNRYTKILKRIMSADPVKAALDGIGLEPADFGSHSTRKGSATYVSSCSTAGPSSSSICLRAGWSLPGAQDTYVQYEAAGDMIVGRFLPGLSFESAGFAILPPFFLVIDDLVAKAADLVFPGARPTVRA